MNRHFRLTETMNNVHVSSRLLKTGAEELRLILARSETSDVQNKSFGYDWNRTHKQLTTLQYNELRNVVWQSVNVYRGADNFHAAAVGGRHDGWPGAGAVQYSRLSASPPPL